MIQAGAGKVYIAGGVESTSRAPWKIKRPHSVYETALPEFYERASFAPDMSDPSMIQGAEMWPRCMMFQENYKMNLLIESSIDSGKCKEWKYFSGNITYNR